MKDNENMIFDERYELAIGRIREIAQEPDVPAAFVSYFTDVAQFLLLCDEVKGRLEKGVYDADPAQMKSDNYALYRDILPENYGSSFGNPRYAVSTFGDEMGKLLCFLYAQERGMIAYVFENKAEEAAAHLELFVQVHGIISQEVPEKAEAAVRSALYWFESDYADVIAANRILEMVDPDRDFFTNILMHADLSNTDYLYRYGEYITQNEIMLAEFLGSLPQSEIDKMADTWSEGYRKGFVLAHKPLEKKRTVAMIFTAGFERVARKAAQNFEKMGLRPTILRSGVSALTAGSASRSGFTGAIPNPQYDYDHKDDAALMMDSRYVERRVEIAKTTYESCRELANAHGGPAVLEIFGSIPFEPESKNEAWAYNSRQQELKVKMSNRITQITKEYIIGKERSFTIISFPSPEIASEDGKHIDKKRFEEIFREVIRVNTLDGDLYTRIQGIMIDALNRGTKVHILGRGKNRTDLTVQLYPLTDPDHQAIFENCGADVNIPLGEVFTSPVLKGTNGILHVSQVYLSGLNFRDLEIHFTDGMISSASCANFEKKEDNDAYIRDNILFHHDTLPLGEFAIGTNTTAYAMARKYDIADRLEILIAEKTGPHFAVGDTCYSWEEDNPVFNPDGKEIVARENEVSCLRKTDPSKAYFGCHTDITIPYEELGLIEVIGEDGFHAEIIRDGRFTLPGTEMLNGPLDEL